MMNTTRNVTRAINGPHEGQALILIALSIVGLIAAVALAVDGGNAYSQRRIAQNAADAAAMAGTQRMTQLFRSNNYSGSVGESAEQQIRQVLVDTLGRSSAMSGAGEFEAWFIKRDGSRWGSQQVGQNGGLTFYTGSMPDITEQAIGIWVKAKAQSDTYFARVIGVNKVAADAGAAFTFSGLSGVVQDSFAGPNDGDLMPLILTEDEINRSFGNNMTLICHKQANDPHDPDEVCTDEDDGPWAPGNWGWLDFNGGSNPTGELENWVANGFNPFDGTYQTLDGDLADWGTRPGLRFGSWVNGDPGWRTPVCRAFEDRLNTPRKIVSFPVTDRGAVGQGSNTSYFITNIATVELTAVSCNGQDKYITGRFLKWGWSGATVSPSGTIADIITYKTYTISAFR